MANFVFQQRVSNKGDMEFRTKFGRNKAVVLRLFESNFYVDIYDNRPGKNSRISFGFDELEELIQMRNHKFDHLKEYIVSIIHVCFSGFCFFNVKSLCFQFYYFSL